jgi:hypothetical protein
MALTKVNRGGLNTGISDSSDATAITIDSSEKVGIGQTTPVRRLHIKDTSADMYIGLEGGTSNNVGILMGDTDNHTLSRIRHDNSDNALEFHTNETERMRVHSSGKMSINGTSEGSSHVTIYFASASYSALASQMTDNGSGAGFLVCRTSDGSTIGQVARNGTSAAVQFLTSSDYRLKENINYDFDATSKIKQLKPCKFTWKNDDSNVVFDGFLAHEVQEIVPYAINGKKDAVDENGKIEAQSIDKSDLVPLLVKTIQELEARITALESA